MIEIWDRHRRHAVRTGLSLADDGGVLRITYCNKHFMGTEARRVSLRTLTVKDARDTYHVDCQRCIDAIAREVAA